jgi:hypothetical protein
MKKTILAIGLFTLALVSTSFASPKKAPSSMMDKTIDGNGNQDTRGRKKVDYYHNQNIKKSARLYDIGGNGSQDPTKRKKDE